MTDYEMRIAIAEACGWKRWKSKDGKVRLRKPTDFMAEYWRSEGCEITADEITEPLPTLMPVPDYPNDLNACREFEKLIYDNERTRMHYFLELAAICDTPIKTVMATARQRAEAFLMTINQRKETK